MVNRVYVGTNGVPCMDLVNGHGQAEYGVPIPVLGGSAQCYIYVPPASAAAGAQDASKVIGVNGASILPGLAFPAPAAGGQTDPEFEAPEANRNYPERHALQDIVLANGGSKVIIAQDGSVAIQSPQASPVRIQLPPNGQLRISQGDELADQAVPLGQATLEVLQTHTAAINDLAAKIAGLTAEIATALQLATLAGTAAGAMNPITFCGSLAASGNTMFKWSGFDRLTTPDENLLSSVLAVSRTTLAEADGADTNETL